MRTIRCVAAAALGAAALLLGAAPAVSGRTDGTPSLDPELQSAIAARAKANREGDLETVRRLMAEDYVQTDVFGRVQNRSQWLSEYFEPLAALIQSGQFRWEVFEDKDVQSHRFGETVVLVGSLTLEGRGARIEAGRGWVAAPDARFGPVTLRFTRVWVRQDGKWLLAALHNAPLPAPARAGADAKKKN